jgi:hypothetical protein
MWYININIDSFSNLAEGKARQGNGKATARHGTARQNEKVNIF